MTSLIEVMAAGLANANRTHDHWSECASSSQKAVYREQMRAALRALLEHGPTERMLEAAIKETDGLFQTKVEAFSSMFRAMLRAELDASKDGEG